MKYKDGQITFSVAADSLNVVLIKVDVHHPVHGLGSAWFTRHECSYKGFESDTLSDSYEALVNESYDNVAEWLRTDNVRKFLGLEVLK